MSLSCAWLCDQVHTLKYDLILESNSINLFPACPQKTFGTSIYNCGLSPRFLPGPRNEVKLAYRKLQRGPRTDCLKTELEQALRHVDESLTEFIRKLIGSKKNFLPLVVRVKSSPSCKTRNLSHSLTKSFKRHFLMGLKNC